MSHYNHLTPKEREKILVLRSQGCSITKIAATLGRNKSTISRELSRNASNGEYSAAEAQETYRRRRRACKPKSKLSDPRIYESVCEKFVEHQWSPEEISERLKLESSKIAISYATIYRGIHSGLFDKSAAQKTGRSCKASRLLRHHGKTRHTKAHVEKRGKIIISNDLSDRPEIASQRGRLGDWEGDTVAGIMAGQCLVTLTDRKSRYLLCVKAEKKNAVCVRDAMIECLQGQPLHTITPDRGKEFAKHAEVTAALDNVPFYFPQPHQPWQRGTNENTNGLLREYFPKGDDLSKYSDEYIQSKVDELNRRPRKCLGFRTPYEIYHSVLLHLT